MSEQEHPDIHSARISGRARIIVALIAALSGWGVAGLTVLSGYSPDLAGKSTVGDEATIQNQITEIEALEMRLRCISLDIAPILPEIESWKEYMRATAETTQNASLRHSRTATWFGQVDRVILDLQKLAQYATGQRNSC